MDKVVTEIQSKAESCIRVADDFTRLYYNTFDRRRNVRLQISRLYMDNGVFVWNGNGATGKDNIQKYFVELPASEHNLTTLDAQPVVDDAVGGQTTVTIQTSGTVKYTDQPIQFFFQSFLITAQEEKWKIVTDAYRLQDSANRTSDQKIKSEL